MAKLNRARLRRVAHATLIGLVFAVILSAYTDSKCVSMLCEGDFPAFYSAAVLAAQGNWEGLADQELHSRLQNEFWPSMEKRFYLSAYPPYLAVFLSPLAYFEPQTAKSIFSALNLFAVLISVVILTELNPRLKAYRYELCAFTLLWYPVLVGASSGQLAGFNMLLFSLGLKQLYKNNSKAKFLAGIIFGLWLIKPQFGLATTLMLLCMGEFICVSGFAVIALCFYLIGAYIQGVTWPLDYYRNASSFHDLDLKANGFQMISFDGALQHIFGALMPHSTLEVVALIASLGLMVTTAIITKSKKPTGYLLFGPAILLSSGHALFYDLGLGVIALLGFLNFERKDYLRTLAGFFIATTIFGFLRWQTSIPIFFLLTLGMYVYLLNLVLRSNSSDLQR